MRADLTVCNRSREGTQGYSRVGGKAPERREG